MNVGVCIIRLRLPGNQSLKGKRALIRPLLARVSHQFPVAIAEVGDNDRWQLATLGISCVSNDRRHCDEMMAKIVDFVEMAASGMELLGYHTEIIPFNLSDGYQTVY